MSRILSKRTVLTVCLSICALAAVAYLFFERADALKGRFSLSPQQPRSCLPPDVQAPQPQKTNPNKMLFISCGSFFD